MLLPLAGPTPDTFDDEDIEKLPIDLQYLDESKKIEEDTDIRKLLLESLLQVTRYEIEHSGDVMAVIRLKTI